MTRERLARSTVAAATTVAVLTLASGFSHAQNGTFSKARRLPVAQLQLSEQSNAAPMGCLEACVKAHELCVQKKEKSEVECYADMNKCLVACQTNH